MISLETLVDQSLGTAIYSVESNLTISAGGTVNRYFHRYPSPETPAAAGSRSVNVGSSRDAFAAEEIPADPLSKQI